MRFEVVVSIVVGMQERLHWVFGGAVVYEAFEGAVWAA